MINYWRQNESKHVEAITRLRVMRDLAKAEERTQDVYIAKKELTWHSIELSICRDAINKFN